MERFDIPKTFMAPRSLVDRLADFRHARRFSSEGEAIRLLLETGLQTLASVGEKEAAE